MEKILADIKIGYKFYFAKEGKEAISQHIAHRPYVTLMDIVMPNVDGVKASEAIKKFDPNVSIIVISTKDNQNTLNAVIKNGFTKNYVYKSWDSSVIIRTVSKILAIKKKIEIAT